MAAPTPFIPHDPYDLGNTRHLAQIRALLAALIILLVCLSVIAANV